VALVAPERADVAQHVGGGDRQVERELGGDVDVREPSYAVRPEQSTHAAHLERIGTGARRPVVT
jgi:hypothetical protein